MLIICICIVIPFLFHCIYVHALQKWRINKSLSLSEMSFYHIKLYCFINFEIARLFLTPKCVRFNKQMKFNSFGYDAENKYYRLVKENEHHGYSLSSFKWHNNTDVFSVSHRSKVSPNLAHKSFSKCVQL